MGRREGEGGERVILLKLYSTEIPTIFHSHAWFAGLSGSNMDIILEVSGLALLCSASVCTSNTGSELSWHDCV